MSPLVIAISLIFCLIIAYVIYKNFKFKKQGLENHKLKFERIKPLNDKLEDGQNITKEEVLNFVEDAKTRELAYQVLSKHNKLDLFPNEYLTIELGAESNLVNWLEFPTELGKAPDAIQYIEKVTVDFDGHNIFYHVFKYKTFEPHWASKNGWMIGVVGPYFKDSKPYDFPVATFSRCSSKIGEVKPKDEVLWVHENIAMKR